MRSFPTNLTRTLSAKPVLYGSIIGLLVFVGIIATLQLLIFLTQSEQLYMPTCYEFDDSFSYYNPGFVLFVFLFLGQLIADAVLYFAGLGFLGTSSFVGYALSSLPFALVGILVVSGRKVWAIVVATLLVLGFGLSYWLSRQIVDVACNLQTPGF